MKREEDRFLELRGTSPLEVGLICLMFSYAFLQRYLTISFEANIASLFPETLSHRSDNVERRSGGRPKKNVCERKRLKAGGGLLAKRKNEQC